MNNKDFRKFYTVEYDQIKDVLIPNPFDDMADLAAKHNFPVTIKDFTYSCIPDKPKVITVAENLLNTTYGMSLARCVEILRICPVPECMCKLMKYWLLQLVNTSFFGSVNDIKKIVYLCWEIFNHINNTVFMKPILAKVLFRTVNMILKEHGVIAPYCAKIGILVFQKTTPKFAIYTFSWNNYKTKVCLSQLHSCNFCKTYDTVSIFKMCSGCRKAYYCGPE